MPSFTAAGALLNLSLSIPIWSWPTWQKLTGITEALWESEDCKQFDWSNDALQAVKAFVSAAKPMTQTHKLNFFKKKADNNSLGRDSWIQWVNRHLTKDWRIHEVVLEGMNHHTCGPRFVLRREKTRKVNVQLTHLIYQLTCLPCTATTTEEHPCRQVF